MSIECSNTGRVAAEQVYIAPEATLLDAMTVMTRTSISIVLVVDSQELLVGVVVDGDIRRALVEQADFDCPVSQIMTRQPRTAPHDVSAKHLHALAATAPSPWLPLVDETGRVRGLIDLVKIRSKNQRLKNAAVIMAGGRGRRLMPHTEYVPKPMIPVGGRPLLEILIRVLSGHGFERFYLSVNYRASQIEEHFGDGSAFGVWIQYLRESRPLGTAGSLTLIDQEEKQPLLVMNGDVLSNFDPQMLISHHERAKAKATIMVRNHTVDIPYGVIELSTDGKRVSAIREKPVINCPVNAGIYVLDPSVIAMVPEDEPYDMPRLLEELETREPGCISAFSELDYWIDIGRSEDLERARAEFGTHFLSPTASARR